jgi:ubiquinone/menaquinone biosynthesis C-methylase UbiE
MFDGQTRKVKVFYRRFADKYDEMASGSHYKRIYDEITWRFIEPFLPETGMVLDAGGGTGRWAIPIANKGLRVVVYDISKEMLQVASRKAEEEGLSHLITTLEGDVKKIRASDDAFDFVLAEGDPISYCGNPEKAVQELARVLKPGCYISAGVDNVYSIAFSMLNMENKPIEKIVLLLKDKRFYIEDLGFYTWAFTPKGLRELFTKSGLEVVKLAGKPVLFLGKPETSYIFEDQNKVRKLVETELELCEEQTLLGLGGHLHIVARKPV